MSNNSIAYDCKFFKGEIPCAPNKAKGAECFCEEYTKVDKHILIIKLAARGDVIRSTPLLLRIKKDYPNAKIYWLTDYPECVPSIVDEILTFDIESVLFLEQSKFDIVFNLEKEKRACALINRLKSLKKKGYCLDQNNMPAPIDKDAEHFFMTGISDNYSRKHKRSYPDEMFEICGYEFNMEKYIMDAPPVKSSGYIGLNTGCGSRWKARLWPAERWIELAGNLIENGYKVLLLGGEAEDEKNRRIKQRTGADYLGYVSLSEFIGHVALCDLVVTSVTMAMHYAIALEKKIILFNNVFNKAEFELYSLGKILEPDKDCKGCYSTTCEDECIAGISAQNVFSVVQELYPVSESKC